ncbi:hypothetical protein N7532_002081 [Penicillium argentinense]|uniref:Uncharacterized protein n=1 Tax=Penicillium argentinense TaxID=1131581 RepID=A0A9W9G3X4_9EURO|nr:uncharacterized protein N7532_002081 [Penicillium argentinense]KAJ5111546.1 hypothetical protein N7532_002081 [Penicillium argentinense]
MTLDPAIGPTKKTISVYWSIPQRNTSSNVAGKNVRTASYQLLHCFGIAHRVYYASSMQGSASVCEDARQPPYLCPVDLAKVIYATSITVLGRYRSLLEFFSKTKNKGHKLFCFFRRLDTGKVG